jgi:thymidine phosphorylase
MNADNTLPLRRLGIDTYQEPVVYMHRECYVCRSEGFQAQSRVRLQLCDRSLIATLNVIQSGLLTPHEAGLSETAWLALEAKEGDRATFSHPPPLASESALRQKVYGGRLGEREMDMIVRDIAAGRYSDLQLAAFVTAGAGDAMDERETLALTRTMIGVGERLRWPYARVADKHSVGGLPGNRTTLIVVPVVAALGLPIPKTSSRAITSPAGSADTMEVLAPVDLDIPAMRKVVEREGACIVWGGTVRLSPADDILIRVARPLDFDSDGQLVASVLSKKAAAGSTHVVIDMPVGCTAKVRSDAAAARLTQRLTSVGKTIGLDVRVLRTDGTQPVGRGIGPALEARDVLAVLQNQPAAPADLRERALLLSAELVELYGAASAGSGSAAAREALASGAAWRKFQAICAAQGGMRDIPRAEHRHVVAAAAGGSVAAFDNRKLAKAAKLAGAPRDAAAGLELHVRLGDRVERGAPLFTLHAESQGALDYALAYLDSAGEVAKIGAPG